DSRTGFIIDAIENLTQQIRKLGGNLYVFHDEPEKVFCMLIDKYKPEAVFTSKAFSWSVEKIEEKIATLCQDRGISFYSLHENFLVNLANIPYRKVFTPFFKEWVKQIDSQISPLPDKINTPPLDLPDIYQISSSEIKHTPNTHWKYEKVWDRLKNFNFLEYENTRNRLDMDGTSKLSPYIRFGIISLRKLYSKAREVLDCDGQFIKELAWREFWYHIKFNFPELKSLEFQEKRRKIKWQNRDDYIEAFTSAKTGYPIIDAAIRQLKEEGWMHNRARLIVANFLCKDLLVDWRVGEAFFMEFLLDYDEVVNVGNWQWCASVGPDPRPLRIFNPILQAKKFDPEAQYIKKYLPELKNLPPEMLHDPLTFNLPYYKPIVNHFEQVKIIKDLYTDD
ncbi:MAG: deoxyribodipyrimidine photo-lyase, partial [Thermodesulfobacteriaceae bacterium]|nr:deoxyribodipyrimidine photo-lyase [Thermodesulfobacteriaceae bacterium]